MRKLFSLIAAVLFAGSMMAESVTLTMSDFAATSFTDQTSGISVATAKNSGSTEPAYNSNGADLRVYAKGSITISASKNITAISFTISTAGKKRLAPLTASVGEVAVAGTPDFTAEWTGSATSVTLTVGDKADYGTDGNAKAGQLDFTAMVVTLEGGAPVVTDTYTVAGNDAAIFGEAWNPALTANDMTLANGIYKWEKAELDLTAGDIEFKVVKNHSWDVAYPAQNYVLNIAEDGEYTITITFDPTTEAVAAEAVKNEPLADPTNCAEAAAAALSVSANNELYNDGAVYTIEGYVTGIKTAYSSQYNNISFWMADAADGGEVLQAFRAACASEADAPKVGDKVAVTGSLTKYNSTPEFAAGCTFVITEPAAPAEEYYLTGSFRNWATTAESDFHFVANPATAGEYMLKGIALAANAEIKVIGILGENVNWYPAVGGNYTVEAEGEYDIYFRPDGQGGQDWHEGYFYVAAVEPLAAPTNCAEAAEAALSVSANNELYNNGAVYSIRGYVTGIKTAYSDSFHNISFWIADTQDGGEVLQAYRAACASEDDVPAVGAIVEVTGSLTKYNTTPEFAAGCTFVILDDIHTAIDNTNIDAKVIKTIENGQLIIIKNGVRYNAQGAVVR